MEIDKEVERRSLRIVKIFEIVIENLDRSFLGLNGLKIDGQNEPSPFILILQNLISFCNKDLVLSLLKHTIELFCPIRHCNELRYLYLFLNLLQFTMLHLILKTQNHTTMNLLRWRKICYLLQILL